MPNQTPEIKNDHEGYQSFYQMSFQETAEITTNRWSPMLHRKQPSTEAAYRDGLREVNQECTEVII
jgi:hypothetical protein